MTRITRIYVLRDPRTDEIRYVGKTVKSLRERLYGHIHCSKSGNTYRDRWVASLLADGVRPVIEQIQEAMEDWAQREAHWIAHYRSAGARLANHTDGGEGTPGLIHSDEFRRAQSQRTKAAMTPERRAQHSLAMKAAHSDASWSAARADEVRRRCADPAFRASQSKKTKATMTPERLAQMSEMGRAQMTGKRLATHIEKLKITTSDPAWRARQSAAIKATMTPERRAEISAKTKAAMTPELRAILSARTKAYHAAKKAALKELTNEQSVTEISAAGIEYPAGDPSSQS